MKTFIKWIISLFSLTNEVKEDINPPVKKRVLTKKPDTTKLTQHHFDYILESYHVWKEYNQGLPRKYKVPIEALCRQINAALGLDKSQRALSRVWLGEINREDLPVGKPINVNSDDDNLAAA